MIFLNKAVDITIHILKFLNSISHSEMIIITLWGSNDALWHCHSQKVIVDARKLIS